MSQTAIFYNKIAKIYPVFNLFVQEPKKRLLAQINREARGSLLEVGVGRGDNLPYYTHAPVTGVDVSEGMLAYARKRAPADCTLHIMDATRLEFFDCSFDYGVISHVLTVVPNPVKVMDEMYRVVKPGGKVFLLNHESTGPFREKLNRQLAPLTRLLHFSALCNMESLLDPQKFTLLHKTRHGFLPSITLMVLGRK